MEQIVFTNGNQQPVGTVYTIAGPNNGAFNPDTWVETRNSPRVSATRRIRPRGPPPRKLEGSFPTWTIRIDDGGEYGAARTSLTEATSS